MSPEPLKTERLRRENAKLKAERDILARTPTPPGIRCEFAFFAKH